MTLSEEAEIIEQQTQSAKRSHILWVIEKVLTKSHGEFISLREYIHKSNEVS